MRTRILACVAASVLVGLPSCTFHSNGGGQSPQPSTPSPPIASGTLDTASMQPSFSAQSDGTSVKVYAALLGSTPGPNSGFVQLDPGESFTATLGGETLPLTLEPSPSDNHIHYAATFPEPGAAAEVVIAFQRPAGKTSAPMSTVTVAAPFEFASPLATTFHRGDPLTLALAPARSPLPASAAGRMAIAFEGACMPSPFADYEYGLDVQPDGTATFTTGGVLFGDEAGQTQGISPGCDVTIHVRADTSGKLDPAFGNGGFEGLQERLAQSHITR